MLVDWQSLSLAQQVAQMVVVRASGHLFDQQIEYPAWEPPESVLKQWIQELGVGGVILLGGSAIEVGWRSHQLQEWATVPLLMGADIEEGVGQRFAGATRFPPPMALNAIAQQDMTRALAYAQHMGDITAREAVAIGLNWLYAPVVDVNNNSENPVINIRAWGETPAVVSQLTTAFIQGTQSHPVLTSAKHFPGHGDTAIDSHLSLPVIAHDRQRLEAIELSPFQAAIAAGVDSVMTAHLKIPALDPEYPATLSHKILTGELRQRLNFDGLIVTDALIMGAIANQYGTDEAAVLAVAAGADVVLMPAHPVSAVQAICHAVATERISIDRIHASLQRIWQAKRKVFAATLIGDTTHAWEQVPPTPINLDAIAQPDAIATAETIVRESMQVYQPALSRLNQSYAPDKTLRNLILVDDALNCAFLARQTPAIALPQMRGYHLQIMDQFTPKITLDPDKINFDREIHLDSPDWQPTLLQLFIRNNPFRDSSGLIKLAHHWLEFLLQTEQLQALILYGTPYVLDQFVTQLPPDIPYIFTYGQMETAQSIALETLFGGQVKEISDRTFTD